MIYVLHIYNIFLLERSGRLNSGGILPFLVVNLQCHLNQSDKDEQNCCTPIRLLTYYTIHKSRDWLSTGWQPQVANETDLSAKLL